jgi:hypothetical protein
MLTALWTRSMDWLRQFMCGLSGHDELLHFETGRLSMRCATCGHESPGWDLKSAPLRREPAQDRKARVLHLPVAAPRRVA